MIGDKPAVFKRSKVGSSEAIFAEVYNLESANYRLLACNQDFSAFDFWLMDKNEKLPPRLVELKTHFRHSYIRDMVGCDFIKVQKLRSLAAGTKAYIFHLFTDMTLIQDVDQPLDEYREIMYGGRPIILGLVNRDKLKVMHSIGLDRLQKILDARRAQVSPLKSPQESTAQKI